MRTYERGENRFKHVGTSIRPEIVFDHDEPVGKCPAGRPAEWRHDLLASAVGHIVRAPYSEAFPKRLYNVDHDGTIYTAQTSNPGQSYHGYPYAGFMGRRLIAALRKIASEKRCEAGFEAWLKRHVKPAGKPDI